MSILKTHIALNVTNLEKSLQFYRTLFGIDPMKYKVDYAKFDVNDPPLNLTLNLSDTLQPGGTLSHLGIQVENSQAVQDAIQRFKQAGLALFEEHNTDCCYALQDKVWLTDPDGNRWEIFVVKVADTTPEDNRSVTENSNPQPSITTKPCCS